MRLDGQFLTAILPGGCPEDELEGILGVNGQSRNLGGLDALVLGDDAHFRAIAVETQAPYVGSREIDLIPFEYNGCLGSVSAANNWCFWRRQAISAED